MRRSIDLAEDVAYAWRTDPTFRAAWREYMQTNELAHGVYLRRVRRFDEHEAVMPWHPDLEAFRAHRSVRRANHMTVTSTEHRRV